jgi:homoserine kinase type II
MAVYTEVSDEELARFIASYRVGALLSFKGIAEGVENTNYLVHTEAGPFFLTLYEKRVAPADLPFFLGLMEHLASAGIRCPTPVRDAEGQSLRQLAGRPAALVTFLEGVWIRRPQVAHCAAVGQAMARLHLAGQNFSLRRANALGLSGWYPVYARFKDHADEIAPGLGITIEQELEHLASHWPTDLAQGVIHADLFPDNVFFLGDQLSGLIDFYFACNDALIYDVAIALNAWCFESDHSFNMTKGQALLKGYQAINRRNARHCRYWRGRPRCVSCSRARTTGCIPPRRPSSSARIPSNTCVGSNFTAPSIRPASMDWDDRSGKTGRGDPHRRRLFGQPRPGRMGCDFGVRQAPQRDFRRRAAHDQQPHGADGRDCGA